MDCVRKPVGYLASSAILLTRFFPGLIIGPRLTNGLRGEECWLLPPHFNACEAPQSSVNLFKGPPSECDLTIVILWSRLGTVLLPTLLRKDGSRLQSGTIWEYENALEAGRPVWVYRRTEEPIIKLKDPDYNMKLHQYEAIERFFESFRNSDGSLKGGVNEYGATREFENLLKNISRHFSANVLKREILIDLSRQHQ